MQEIHHKYGVTEKANYEIQLFVETLLKEQKEQLRIGGVIKWVACKDEQLKAVQKLKDFAYEVCPLHREDDLEEIVGSL